MSSFEGKQYRKSLERLINNQAIYTFDKIIGIDENFVKTIEYAKTVSDCDSTVLITGESGTGKEIFAQSIHNNSSRKEMPFIAVNCGAIPSNLIEAELFGYEEGAFTGAKKSGNIGKFEAADGGTIFLDEIGEMSLEMQVRLLRVIEEGVISRIGSSNQIPVNFRIIAATNKDLSVEVRRGNFRKDLYYRINVIPIYLPALRERKADIPILIDYYMNKICKKSNKEKQIINKTLMGKLIEYDWPGNIRELQNIIERMVNTRNVSEEIYRHLKANIIDSENVIEESVKFQDMRLETMEKKHILTVLKSYDGNVSLAANALGIGRNTLYRKMKKYCIEFLEVDNCTDLEQ